VHRHPGDIVEMSEHIVAELARKRVLWITGLRNKINQRHEIGVAARSGVPYRLSRERGEFPKNRAVTIGRAPVEACAARVDLEVPVEEEW
jgi:hypothetical protein